MKTLEWRRRSWLAMVGAMLLLHTGVDAQRGQQGPPPPRRMVIVDRSGNQTLLGIVPGNTNGPRISPDGARLAYGVDGLYVGPLGDISQMKRIGPGRFPSWSHDGTRLFFEAPDAEIMLWRRIDTDDAGEQLTAPARAPESRSRDGRFVSFVQSVDMKFSGWWLDLTTRTRTQIPDSDPEALGTNISPDGRWIAYQSTKSGRYEVWVQPLGRPGPAVQVTTMGALRPLWSADMREIVFDDGKQQLWTVPIRTEPAFSVAGEPAALPIKGFVQAGVGRRMYDQLPDGRFVMMFPQ
jgi:serine/threonine-protein kinase